MTRRRRPITYRRALPGRVAQTRLSRARVSRLRLTTVCLIPAGTRLTSERLESGMRVIRYSGVRPDFVQVPGRWNP